MAAAAKLSLLQLEMLRLKRKGLRNNIIALVLLITFFLMSHGIGKLTWELYVIPNYNQRHLWYFIVVGGCITHTLTMAMCFLFLLPMYRGQGSWLDEYAIKVQAFKS